MTLSPARENALGCAALSAIVSLAAFAGLQLWAAALAGVFEYPLDDVYIHMAMAEGIASGTYGVNPGEASSAASSILYPLLLVPFAGTEMQRWMPLFWNIVGVAAVGALWGMVVARANLSRVVSVLLAIIGPLALNVPGVGYTGMEHCLHTAFALASVLGLWIFLQEDRISALLVIGVIGAPLFRFEGLALSGLICLVLMFRGRFTSGLGLGLVTLLPIATFMVFLVSIGLPPVPGSIIAKTQLIPQDVPKIPGVVRTFILNCLKGPGFLLLLLSIFCGAMALFSSDRPRTGGSILLGVGGLAGLAHLLAGQIGWMNRYEHYAFVILVSVLVLSLPLLTSRTRRTADVALTVTLVATGSIYWSDMTIRQIWMPRAIQLQQAQMARFAKEFVRRPVAVNDLGWVTWQNDQYVLDLFGLGSSEALVMRLAPGGPSPGWGGELAMRHGVDLVMIYDSWFADAVAPSWRKLGEMTMGLQRGALSDWTVTFYATSAEAAPGLQAKLAEFIPTLPADARFTMAEGAQ